LLRLELKLLLKLYSRRRASSTALRRSRASSQSTDAEGFAATTNHTTRTEMTANHIVNSTTIGLDISLFDLFLCWLFYWRRRPYSFGTSIHSFRQAACRYSHQINRTLRGRIYCSSSDCPKNLDFT